MATKSADLSFDLTIDKESKDTLTSIIKVYWDCFVKDETKRALLGYQFGIDTGGAKPVCCKKPSYGTYESKVIMTQVNLLLGNKWIERCEGPWGLIIALAKKTHQDKVMSI